MTKIITVGIDGSDAALRAMDWAADEAARRGAIVKVVGCLTTPTVYSPWYVGIP